MTSRVLSGDEARPSETVTWPHYGPASHRTNDPAAERADGENPRECEALRARIAGLEREIEQREQKARNTGMEQGRAAGEQEAAARLNAVIERFGAAANELVSHRKRLRREAEADVVKLAIAIARRVLHRELNADPEAMLGLVKAALDKLDGREVDRIRVHPADAAAVQAQMQKFQPAARFEVLPDQRLDRGAAIFETARGSLDGSAETQLAEIERGLIDRLRS
jgi:flagellar assembly protein FliH